MKKVILAFSLLTIIYSCGGGTEKDKITNLLKDKIGNQLPFKDVKIASIESGTGVIIDGSWCYWIDSNNKIYCVNGSSKTIYNANNPKCEDAPIQSRFSDIEKIAK